MNLWFAASQSTHASPGTSILSTKLRVTHGRVAATGSPWRTVISAFSIRFGQKSPSRVSVATPVSEVMRIGNMSYTKFDPLRGFHGC